jgi:hypothetical protein
MAASQNDGEGTVMSRIIVLVAATAAFAVLVVAPSAQGAGLPTYGLTGIETSVPTGNTSSFAGAAFSLTAGTATWSAKVPHNSLSGCTIVTGNPCSTILDGGSFTLGSLTGTFTAGGTITLISGSPITCTSTAVFDVRGGVAINGGGTGTFHIRLTHYQTKLFGLCIPYFATVTGSFGP